MKGSFLFLGTGSSNGTPVLGCKCAVCLSPSPLNKRFRPSGLFEIEGMKILLDAGPDLKQQAFRFGIDFVDGLILTHTHFDHIAGIDELRPLNIRHKKPIPLLLSKESYEELKLRYNYLFHPIRDVGYRFTVHILEGDVGVTEFLGLPIGYCTYLQAGMKVNGYRFGEFAYVTDIYDYDEALIQNLRGVKWLVVSALRETPSPVHLSFRQAAEFAAKVGAKKTWITHINHSVDHESANRQLPSGVELGYDGQRIEFEIR